VVKLLDTDSDGIVDALDTDGDDQPDDLNSDGSFSDEVTGLNDAGTYQPDSTFWRMAVTHFTPWDCNWPFGPPTDAIPPNPETIPTVDQQQPQEKTCPTYNNSFVENRSRIFHEDIHIPGTDMTLHYASNRVEGYKTTISVPASGETIPTSLKSIIVKIEVAGRILEQILNPLPNQKAEFIWVGLDQLGRQVSSSITAHVKVGFTYDLVYLGAGNFEQAFGQPGSESTGIIARFQETIWKNSYLLIPQPESKGKGLIADGWTLSSQHQISLRDISMLYKGDGTISMNNTKIIDTVAGGGGNSTSEGIPATEAYFNYPGGIARDA